MTTDQMFALTDLVFNAMTEECVRGMQIQRGFDNEKIRQTILDASLDAKKKLRYDIVKLMGGSNETRLEGCPAVGTVSCDGCRRDLDVVRRVSH